MPWTGPDGGLAENSKDDEIGNIYLIGQLIR